MAPLDREANVLLIEDDTVDLEHFSRVLRAAPWVSPSTASCLHRGIEKIRKFEFDVVIFDLGLPDSYGIDTVKRMVEEFAGMPMIVLTGSDNEALAKKAIDLGVRAYLVKGKATDDQIIASIEQARGMGAAQSIGAPSAR